MNGGTSAPPDRRRSSLGAIPHSTETVKLQSILGRGLGGDTTPGDQRRSTPGGSPARAGEDHL